jgi:hypothetical protein
VYNHVQCLVDSDVVPPSLACASHSTALLYDDNRGSLHTPHCIVQDFFSRPTNLPGTGQALFQPHLSISKVKNASTKRLAPPRSWEIEALKKAMLIHYGLQARARRPSNHVSQLRPCCRYTERVVAAPVKCVSLEDETLCRMPRAQSEAANHPFTDD